MSKIACQLIIFGLRNRDDFGGCVKDLADVGYAGVEAGPHPKGPQYLADVAKANGVEISGIHYGYDSVTNVDENVKFMRAAGTKHVMCSGVGDYKSKGIAAYDEAAKVFNKIGKEYRDAGITFCYHNHSWEFQVFPGGTKGIYRLIEATNPDDVKLCVDTYWVLHGGEDPVGFLRRHLNRVGYMHFKDMVGDTHAKEPGTFCEVGSGIIDFPRVTEVLEGSGVEWYTVEQDRTDGDPKESCRMSRDYIASRLNL